MRSIPDPDSTSVLLLAIFKKLASTAHLGAPFGGLDRATSPSSRGMLLKCLSADFSALAAHLCSFSIKAERSVRDFASVFVCVCVCVCAKGGGTN